MEVPASPPTQRGLLRWTFDDYEQHLRQHRDEIEKLEVPKSDVPKLPERFESSVPANGLQNEGAIGSYRDDRETDSVHVIEYEDHWKIHIDSANPRYPHMAVRHLVEDAPVTAVLLVIAIVVLASNW